jgi:hypothetical protein
MNRRKRLESRARRLERQRAGEARKAKRQQQVEAFAARVAEGERRGCLFCRATDGGFTAREHALPESLGATEVVLPNGVVCDRCNNGVLSYLDKALAEFLPIKFRRTTLGIVSKAGKVPVTSFSKGRITNRGRDPATQEPQLFFEIHSRKDTETFKVTDLGDGRAHINFQMTGKPVTPRDASELSRSLLKAAFECAWLDHGEAMFRPEFDHVREAVLGTPRDGYLAFARQADPDHYGMELVYMPLPAGDGKQMIAVQAKVYGFTFVTDSLNPEPKARPPEEHVFVHTFTTDDTAPRRRRSVGLGA